MSISHLFINISQQGKIKKIIKSFLRLASWNIRIMCPGLSNDLHKIDDNRKTAITDHKLTCLKIDIAALQEAILPAGSSLRENDHIFLKGKDPEEPRQHNVGFAIKNCLLHFVQFPHQLFGENPITQFFQLLDSVNIVSIYAPTLCSSSETKDQFYEDLDAAIKSFPGKEHLHLLGGFNAHVGSDHDLWPNCIEHFGVGKMHKMVKSF